MTIRARQAAAILAGVGALVLLSGCQTVSERFSRAPKYTEIVTMPPGATITIDGFGQCDSPCRIDHDDVRRVTVARAGFVKQTFEISPGAGKIIVALDLAAASEGVETDTLPDL